MEFYLKFDWSKLFIVNAAFLLGIVLKFLLDLNLAKFFVKYCYWIPTRFVFRTKPPKLSGEWSQMWDFTGGASFSKDIDRHSHQPLRQFGRYCYAEFISDDKKYSFFGKINHNFLSGEWQDVKDEIGYFGTFQLRILDSDRMEGRWIGHSKSSCDINGDYWKWKKR